MLKLIFGILIITGTAQFSSAQQETVTQSAQWFAMQSLVKVSKNYSILAEGQFRFVNGMEPMQFQARTGLDVHVSKHFTFMPIAYVYTWNPIYGKQPATYSNNEHRTFQQVQYTHKIGIFNFGHRVRLEQRFIEVHSMNNNGEVVNEGYSQYQNRVRYRLQLQIPINNKEMAPGTFYASMYVELFNDFGKNVDDTNRDQNRLFLGAGYTFNKDCALQAGFLEQRIIKASGTKQENNVGFQIIMNYNFDLTKKSI